MVSTSNNAAIDVSGSYKFEGIFDNSDFRELVNEPRCDLFFRTIAVYDFEEHQHRAGSFEDTWEFLFLGVRFRCTAKMTNELDDWDGSNNKFDRSLDVHLTCEAMGDAGPFLVFELNIGISLAIFASQDARYLLRGSNQEPTGVAIKIAEAFRAHLGNADAMRKNMREENRVYTLFGISSEGILGNVQVLNNDGDTAVFGYHRGLQNYMWRGPRQSSVWDKANSWAHGSFLEIRKLLTQDVEAILLALFETGDYLPYTDYMGKSISKPSPGTTQDDFDESSAKVVVRPAHRPRTVVPEGEERKKVGIYIGETDYKKLQETAAEQGLKPTELARKFLLNGLRL